MAESVHHHPLPTSVLPYHRWLQDELRKSLVLAWEDEGSGFGAQGLGHIICGVALLWCPLLRDKIHLPVFSNLTTRC